MAIPANSTPASIAHRRTDIIDPRTLPDKYTIWIDGHKMIPAIYHNTNQVFSTTAPVRKGDIVGLWRRPETLLPGEYQSVAYRLSEDLPAGLVLGDTSHARTPADQMIYVETTNPPERFAFRASEIVAIHKWLGEVHPKQETRKLSQIEREANAEPARAAQSELSLLAPTADGPLTMSSREIAELTEKRHGDVIRDTRVLLDTVLPGWEKDDAILRHQGISITYDNRGYVSEIHLPKDITITLVAGYDANLRLKIIRRWMELEEAIKQPQPTTPQFPIPQTYSEALMLAANQAAQIEHQKTRLVEKDAQIADMRDDVDALDRIAGADGLFGLRETVAMLQTKERKFVAWLQQNGWAYRQTGSKRLLAYADKRKAGYATHKARVYEKPDGSEGVDETLKFTPAGIVKLAKLLSVTLTDADLRMLHGDKGRAA